MKSNFSALAGPPPLTLTAIFLTMILSTSSILGQTTPIFSTVSLSNNQLTGGQLSVKQSYENRPTTTSVQLIDLDNPLDVQLPGGRVFIQVPGDTATYTFTASNIEGYYNGDFYWYGNLTKTTYCPEADLSDDCFSGLLSITGKSGKMFGELRIDTNYYLIPALGGGLNALVKVEKDTGTICISDATPFSPPPSSEERDPCPVVNVLVLYSQSALTAHPDVVDIAEQGFANTKQSLLNSAIPKSTIDIRLVGVELLSGFTESGIWNNDAGAIMASNSNARQMRSSYDADLVMIMTRDVYADHRGRVVAFGEFATASDSAFAFVSVPHALSPTQTFAHEFAHLFGARHQQTDNCATGDDNGGMTHAHAHTWEKGCACMIFNNKRFYKTAESACYDNSQRITILNYSNPDVEYKNKDTGIEDTNDNASVITAATCRISGYVNSNDVNVYILAPPEVCPGDNFTFRGYVNGDYGPYTYHWRYKYGYNGTWSNSITPSPQDEFNITVPSDFYGVIYVELIGENGTDEGIYATGTVVNYLCDNKPATTSPSSPFIDAKAMRVHPNPTTDHLGIRLNKPISGMVEVQITNILGKICFSKSISLGGNPVTQFEVDLPQLPTGQYTMTLQSAMNPPQTAQFAIVK